MIRWLRCIILGGHTPVPHYENGSYLACAHCPAVWIPRRVRL